MRGLLVFIAACVSILPLAASLATVHGATYDWLTLDKLPKAIVSVNTTPAQLQVAENGLYSFELPAGSYRLVAEYRQGNETTHAAEENITVGASGDYVLDLLLFPTEDFFPDTLVEVPDLNLSQNDIETQQPAISMVWLFAGAILLAIVLPAAMLLLMRKRHAKKHEAISERPTFQVSVHKAPSAASAPSKELSPDHKEVLDKIRAAGGSIGQKDLRHTIHVSEAKASMLVSELEALGLLKKIKKGRGNLIKLTG